MMSLIARQQCIKHFTQYTPNWHSKIGITFDQGVIDQLTSMLYGHTKATINLMVII